MLDCLDSRKNVSLRDKSTRNIDKIFVTSNEWKLYNNIENIVGSQYTPHTILIVIEQIFLSFNFEIKFECPFQKLLFLIASWMLKMPF